MRGGCAAHTASSWAEPDSERSEPRRRASTTTLPLTPLTVVEPGFFFTCPPKLKNLSTNYYSLRIFRNVKGNYISNISAFWINWSVSIEYTSFAFF